MIYRELVSGYKRSKKDKKKDVTRSSPSHMSENVKLVSLIVRLFLVILYTYTSDYIYIYIYIIIIIIYSKKLI